MRHFILMFLLFFTPLYIVVFFYLLIDPFKVISNHNESNSIYNYVIISNKDYHSTQNFIQNNERFKYNSFIFGNSRSVFYRVETWKKYISGLPYHFDASSESLFGICCKIKYLDEQKVDIRNALIVLDVSTLNQTKNSIGHLFIKSPTTSKESFLVFHYEMFKGFFPNSFFAFVDLYINGKKDYMKQYGVVDRNIWKNDKISNEFTYELYDNQILTDINSYYADKKNVFFKRGSVQIFSEPIIKKEQKDLLVDMKKILKSQKTKYKIIISPLYDQVKINKDDLSYLKCLFGSDNVFDFSGINSFTSDFTNYYESSHYRPIICDSIMSIIYHN
jgi:hypothetical protein